MNEKCPQCGAKLKESSPKVWGGKDLLMIKFCPKCEYFESYLALIPLIALKGTGLGGSLSDRGVNSASWGLGEFRVRIESPKEDILREKAEIMVKTFPLYFHPTKPPFPAYAELKQGDEVIAAGFLQEREESPLWPARGVLISVILKNLTNGTTSIFVDEHIKLEKGFRRSFTIRNPILSMAENRIEKIIGTRKEPYLLNKRPHCAGCGVELAPNARFCHNCGKSVKVNGLTRAHS